MESVSDIEIFMIASPDQTDPAAGQEDSGIFLQKTKGLSKYSSLSDLGITWEDLKKENFTLKTDNGKKVYLFSYRDGERWNDARLLQSMAERKLLKYTPSNIVVMPDGSTVTRVSGNGETDQDEEAQKEDEKKKDPEEAEKTECRRRGVIRSFKKGERKEK